MKKKNSENIYKAGSTLLLPSSLDWGFLFLFLFF